MSDRDRWAAKNAVAGDREWVVTVFEDGSSLIERQPPTGDGMILPKEVSLAFVRAYYNLRTMAAG